MIVGGLEMSLISGDDITRTRMLIRNFQNKILIGTTVPRSCFVSVAPYMYLDLTFFSGSILQKVPQKLLLWAF